jgi:hypothetical protein
VYAGTADKAEMARLDRGFTRARNISSLSFAQQAVGMAKIQPDGPERFWSAGIPISDEAFVADAETGRNPTRVHTSQEQMDREMIRLDAPRSSAGSSCHWTKW